MNSPSAATRPLLRNFVIVFSLAALVGTFMFATAQSAGEGPRAAQAKVLGGRVVAAVDGFRRLNNGHIPASVKELRGSTLLPPGAIDEFLSSQNPAFTYTKDGESSFQLSFEYTGPGINRCDYVSGIRTDRVEMFAPRLSNTLRTGGALALLGLALAGCSNWNERSSSYANYEEYAASVIAGNGLLPSNLVPRSARDIRVIFNIDSTEVQAEFNFDAAEEAMIELPFLTPDMLRFRQLIKEGQAKPSAASSNTYVRCGSGAVEFLQLARHTHARYWTSWDRQVRNKACPHTFTGANQA